MKVKGFSIIETLVSITIIGMILTMSMILYLNLHRNITTLNRSERTEILNYIEDSKKNQLFFSQIITKNEFRIERESIKYDDFTLVEFVVFKYDRLIYNDNIIIDEKN